MVQQVGVIVRGRLCQVAIVDIICGSLSLPKTCDLTYPEAQDKNTSFLSLRPPPPPLQVGVMEEVSELRRYSEGQRRCPHLLGFVLPILWCPPSLPPTVCFTWKENHNLRA